MGDYLKSQIITYLGNKRKLLNKIEEEIDNILIELKKDGKKVIKMGDGFSGSGVVSRLLKLKCDKLYSNDLAGYSETLNKCYLGNPSMEDIKKIKKYIDKTNEKGEEYEKKNGGDNWIHGNWSPKNDEIKEDDRVYYTYENGLRIDGMRNYIEKIPEKYKSYVLGPLLVECSIHNNTNGQFSAFYKNEEGKGAYGGKKKIDLNRITSKISIPYPITNVNSCETIISRKNTNDWVREIDEELDIMYYDPPYNKHPYNIYYFLLDIINDWDKTKDIPDTTRGQEKSWVASEYNSVKNAKKAITDLLKNTNSKYIIMSYNNDGIVPIDELDKILKEIGEIKKLGLEHKTYNRLKGISNYKREKDEKTIKEYLYIIKK